MKAGSVVLVRFPFSDLESSKKRPSLVLAHSKVTEKVGLVTIAMITSRVDGLRFPGDCALHQWKESGLLHPSLVRFSKVATIDFGLVDRVLGKLSSSDLNSVQENFCKHFRYWIS